MTIRRPLAVLAAIALAIAPTAALAEGNGSHASSLHRLHTDAFTAAGDPSTCSSIGWQDVGVNGDDSPLDTNDRALVSHVCAGEFAQIYTNYSIRKLHGKKASSIKNLSFDFDRNFHFTGGAPRISVIFLNGDVAFLAASGCNNPIGVSSHWSRADFTGAKTGCSITVSGDTGGTYTADGTRSAWQVYTDAHPDQLIDFIFAVEDEPGDYRIDRLALGTNKLYDFSNTKAFNCRNDEGQC